MTNSALMNVPAPLGIASETMDRPQLSISAMGPDGACIATYCPINHCGGIYWINRRMWSLWSPIGAAEFIALLEANRVHAQKVELFPLWQTTVLISGSGPREH